MLAKLFSIVAYYKVVGIVGEYSPRGSQTTAQCLANALAAEGFLETRRVSRNQHISVSNMLGAMREIRCSQFGGNGR